MSPAENKAESQAANWSALDRSTLVAAGAGRALLAEVDQALPMPLHGSLRCEPGELLALVGPSGAGKTSMLRVLAGLMRPAKGRVSVGSEVWCDSDSGVFLPPQARHVGLVFQSYALMPHLSALDNVALSLLHLAPAARRERARHWLGHAQLAPELHPRRPAALSGGQQQRVAVARALAREPKLLLLDEPFSAIDQASRQGLYALLADLRRELGIPIVLVTHDLSEARLLADRMAVMDAGRVLQAGTPAEVYRAPNSARVAELVGLQNCFSGVWLGPAETPGQGRLRWTGSGDLARASNTAAAEEAEEAEDAVAGALMKSPVIRVPDKGRVKPGQRVDWVVPGEALTLVALADMAPGDLGADVWESRALGEVTLITLTLDAVAGARVRIMCSGSQRLSVGLSTGERLALRLDASLVHVMPLRAA